MTLGQTAIDVPLRVSRPKGDYIYVSRLEAQPPVGAAGALPRCCGLRAMEARWISALVDGRALFSSILVKFCWDGALMVTASSLSIMSSRFQSHLGGDVEKLMGVVCFSRLP